MIGDIREEKCTLFPTGDRKKARKLIFELMQSKPNNFRAMQGEH